MTPNSLPNDPKPPRDWALGFELLLMGLFVLFDGLRKGLTNKP